MSVGEIWTQLDRVFKADDCFVQFVLRNEHGTEVIVCAGKIGAEGDGSPHALGSLVPPALVVERGAQILPGCNALRAERRRRGDCSDWACLENWPILDKEALRRNPRAFLADDPSLVIRKVKCPVLVLHGEKDLMVAAEDNVPAIKKALAEGGNKNFKVAILPGLNHVMQKCEIGAPWEYVHLEETMSPLAMEAMRDWIKERTK